MNAQESKIKAMASELFNRKNEIDDLNATNKEKESKLRSYAKRNHDLERRLQEPSVSEGKKAKLKILHISSSLVKIRLYQEVLLTTNILFR